MMFLPKWKWALNERRQMKMSHYSEALWKLQILFPITVYCDISEQRRANIMQKYLEEAHLGIRSPVFMCTRHLVQPLCFFWVRVKRVCQKICQGNVSWSRLWFAPPFLPPPPRLSLSQFLEKNAVLCCFTSDATFNVKKALLPFVITYLACWWFKSLAKQPNALVASDRVCI